MGNQAGSLKKHLETAEKTGALNFTDKGLEKFPPELFKVHGEIFTLSGTYKCTLEHDNSMLQQMTKQVIARCNLTFSALAGGEQFEKLRFVK